MTAGSPVHLGRGLTPVVRALLIANVVAYAASLLYVNYLAPSERHGHLVVAYYLCLSPTGIEAGHLWQVVTYLFFHDLRSPLHIFFNLFVLWMFGGLFAPLWGVRRFLTFYFACGLGGAAAVVLTGFVFPTTVFFQVPVLGASAAVLGFVIAYGVVFPDRPVFLFFVVPIPGRYLALATVGVDLVMNFLGQPVASHAHIGGMATAYLLLTGYWRPSRLRRLYANLSAARRRGPRKKRTLRAVDDRDRDRK